MKRVYCLYRVSTLGQVEKDDIPMQRQRCHEFAEMQGWEIVQEFSEKGVSGFKVSAKDRDAIQEIQRDAALGKFDILLVFMFDRLGRKEDETPFVVEWFVNNGIEVWSTEEGQQRFDTHVDKLMNYIRYWQASGESLKTSIRTKTRLGQIVQEGKFRGGTAPYGYQLVKHGRVGKKNKELYDIEINPVEAPTVQRIFDLAEKYGYGGRKIATTLKEEGILNVRTGEPFHYATIFNLLKNIMYMGIMRSGETRSEILPELQIITPEQFDRVSESIKQRSIDYVKKCEGTIETITLADGTQEQVARVPQIYPRRVVGKALLSGNIYCGHCGGRMFASTTKKHRHFPDDTLRVPTYKCYNRTQHKELCNGQTVYQAERVDQVVEKLIRGIFERAKSIDESSLIRDQVHTASEDYQRQLKNAKAEQKKAAKELSKWEDLIMDSLEGKCVFTPEQVKKKLDQTQEKLSALNAQIQELAEDSLKAKSVADDIMAQHKQLLSWAEMFDDASREEKKVIASQLIKAVTLTRGYEMQVEFNITEAQYLSGLLME